MIFRISYTIAKVAGGHTGHGGCRVWHPHQPQDGKREFSVLDSC